MKKKKNGVGQNHLRLMSFKDDSDVLATQFNCVAGMGRHVAISLVYFISW